MGVYHTKEVTKLLRLIHSGQDGSVTQCKLEGLYERKFSIFSLGRMNPSLNNCSNDTPLRRFTCERNLSFTLI